MGEKPTEPRKRQGCCQQLCPKIKPVANEIDQTHKGRVGCCKQCCFTCLFWTKKIQPASFICMVALLLGAVVCSAVLLTVIPKTKAWLEQPDDENEMTNQIVGSILSCTVVLGIMLFIISIVVSNIIAKGKCVGATHRDKLKFARALNFLGMAMLLVLLLVWIAVTLAVIGPIYMIMLFQYMYEYVKIETLDLLFYGINTLSEVLTGQDLTDFYEESKVLLRYYVVALVAAIITQISVAKFMMVKAANFAYLKDVVNNTKSDTHPSVGYKEKMSR